MLWQVILIVAYFKRISIISTVKTINLMAPWDEGRVDVFLSMVNRVIGLVSLCVTSWNCIGLNFHHPWVRKGLFASLAPWRTKLDQAKKGVKITFFDYFFVTLG